MSGASHLFIRHSPSCVSSWHAFGCRLDFHPAVPDLLPESAAATWSGHHARDVALSFAATGAAVVRPVGDLSKALGHWVNWGQLLASGNGGLLYLALIRRY
jgi:hypothetical protein